MLGKLLALQLKNDGAEVKLSRTSENDFKSLSERTREANAWNVDLFISVHRNASPNHTGTGAETLVYSQDLENVKVAEKLQRAMITACNYTDRGIKARPDLHVLKATRMVAILLEVGFIDCPQDNDKFDKNTIRLAEELSKAILLQ